MGYNKTYSIMKKFTLTAIVILATGSLLASDWELYLTDKSIITNGQTISWDTPAGSKTHYFDVGVRNKSTSESLTFEAIGYNIDIDIKKVSFQYCVGGVCREVPASNGLSLTVVTTF